MYACVRMHVHALAYVLCVHACMHECVMCETVVVLTVSHIDHYIMAVHTRHIIHHAQMVATCETSHTFVQRKALRTNR